MDVTSIVTLVIAVIVGIPVLGKKWPGLIDFLKKLLPQIMVSSYPVGLPGLILRYDDYKKACDKEGKCPKAIANLVESFNAPAAAATPVAKKV